MDHYFRGNPGWWLVNAILIVLIVLVGSHWAFGYAPGTLLFSRNTDEAQNTTPGFWNHVAVVVNDCELVESQSTTGVVKTKIEDYLKRPYSTIVAMQPRDAAAGIEAASRALQLVGKPYRPASSVFIIEGKRRQDKGLNCVSVAKVAWGDACPAIRYRRTPDRVLALTDRHTFNATEGVRAPTSP